MSNKETIWFKWIILASGFYVQTFVLATLFAFSSLLGDLLAKFRENTARTAMVQAIFRGCGLCVGIFSGMLISRFGMRKISLIGGIMAPLGFILSYLATSIFHLYICIGIVAGIGTSFMVVSSTAAVSQSFSGSRRLLALSIQNAGVSVGGALTPYLFDYFVKMYGLNGTFLLMGGIYLNCLPAAILFSIPNKKRVVEDNCASQHTDNADSETQEESSSTDCHTEIKRLKTDINKVMRSPFILTVLGVGFGIGSLGGFNSLILNVLKWKGFQPDEALLAFPTMSGVGFAGRLLPGITKQIRGVSTFVCPICFSFCGAVGQLIFLFCSDNLSLLIGCGFLGLAMAGVMSGANVAIAQILDKDLIAVGVGIMYSTLGILVTMFGPIYGAIMDAGQSYDVLFYSTLAFQLAGTTLLLAAVFTRKVQSKESSEIRKGRGNLSFNVEE